MEIQIGDKWKIGSDEMNLVLYKKSKEKEGEKRKGDGWKVVGYYIDFEHIANDIVDLSTYAFEADTMQKLIKDTSALKKQLKTCLLSLKNDSV